MRMPARVERPRDGVATVAETPAFWLMLGLAGLVAVAMAAGGYLFDRRAGAGTPTSTSENLAAAGAARDPAPAASASSATRPAPAAVSAAHPVPVADAIPSPQEWLDKAEELVDSVVPRLSGTSTPAPAPLTPLVPAPLARDDIGPDAPAP
ncbi:MAG TPA: hypothetical protein VMR43_08555, partial [Variovorax sp.]|nr:hypothetical protein [Variovorax sp.]